MIVHVVAVGRVRDPGLRAACEAYATRAGRYLHLQIREVPDGGRRPAAERRRVEARALRRALPAASRTVAFTRGGDRLNSRAFADRVERWEIGARDVALVIGGAEGLDDDFLAGADERIRLSSMTLPHEMARVILLEQLYRAGTIRRGEPYHRGA